MKKISKKRLTKKPRCYTIASSFGDGLLVELPVGDSYSVDEEKKKGMVMLRVVEVGLEKCPYKPGDRLYYTGDVQFHLHPGQPLDFLGLNEFGRAKCAYINKDGSRGVTYHIDLDHLGFAF